jgi:hypothetical protein
VLDLVWTRRGLETVWRRSSIGDYTDNAMKERLFNQTVLCESLIYARKAVLNPIFNAPHTPFVGAGICT